MPNYAASRAAARASRATEAPTSKIMTKAAAQKRARTAGAAAQSQSEDIMSKPSPRGAKRAAQAPVQAMQETLQKAFGPRHKVLKRSGMRPLTFDGVLLAEANSHSHGTRLWYEINLYRNDSGGYVAEVKLFRKAEQLKDLFRAESFPDLAAMTAWLEAHDPAVDAVVDIEAADTDAPLALAALGAIRMRQAIDEARREYRYLTGELLYALGVAD